MVYRHLSVRKFFFFLYVSILVLTAAHAQNKSIHNTYITEKGLLHLQKERGYVYKPINNWMYSHHPSITYFNNKFIAIWSNGRKDEDAPGQRVLFSRSPDGLHWSEPMVLAHPSLYRDDTLNVLTAAGFHSYRDTLVAYYGEYSPHKTNTCLWAKTSTDGLHWSKPINMHLPVNPNQGPVAIANRRLIICGNFTFSYTDDPLGIRNWHLRSFYADSLYTQDNPASFYAPAAKNKLPPLCEASFFQTPEGAIHAMLRVTGNGWKGRLWLTESKDNGEHWSLPVETAFTDNDSKFQFGKFPAGNTYFYVGIPDTLHHYARTPLVLALAQDGTVFNQEFIIADEPYTLQKKGLWKGGQYGYPNALFLEGYLYVIVSRQKESIEVLKVTLE